MPEDGGEPSAIPRIYPLNEAAELLRVAPRWLRAKLAAGEFDALKRAGRWAMTEPQILAAIEQMTVKARPRPAQPEPRPRHEPEVADESFDFFSKLSPRSQAYWRNKAITGSTRSPGRQPNRRAR